MKNLIYIFVILTFLISCSQKKEKKEIESVSETPELNIESEKLALDKNSNNTLADWIKYYEELEPNFQLNYFEFKSVDSLQPTQGNVFGDFDKNFESIYSDFIVHRTDKKQYVDFDSYQWTLDENKVPLFSPDQEINLIDQENQTVTRIGFRGPSQWVEDAFWKNDSTIVLLENTYEKKPIISKLDLSKKLIKTYIYKDSLYFDSKYSELRFKKKGLKYEKHTN